MDRNNFVSNRHGGADGTSHPRMGIGHDPDLTASYELLVEQMLNLRQCALLSSIGKYLGRVIFSL